MSPQKMKTIKGYLVLSESGIERSTKGQVPKLNFGEIACGISITVPVAVFRRPTINVEVTLDGPYEASLSQEVRDDIDALLTDSGFNVRIEMPEKDEASS